jgi:hypothetical protein
LKIFIDKELSKGEESNSQPRDCKSTTLPHGHGICLKMVISNASYCNSIHTYSLKESFRRLAVSNPQPRGCKTTTTLPHSRSGIAENARLRFGVFMLKSIPSGRGFESRAGLKIIFQIKYTRDVKSMIRVVVSKQKDIRRWSMTIYIDSTYQKRKFCDMVF